MNFLNLRTLAFLLVTVAFCSCRTNKELVYLQNMNDDEVHKGHMFSVLDYKLQKSDNLYVQVTSLDPDVNKLFNPAMGNGFSASAEQQYGSLTAQYLNGHQIEEDGNIDLPIIGKIQVVGKTISEAKALIETKVSEYFKEATVAVKFLSFKYTVNGEVSKPGVYYNYNHSCTLFEAISQANGITNYARPRRVTVLRETKNGTRSIQVDLTDKATLYSDAYYLHPNDVIYVAPDQLKQTRLNASMYSIMISMLSVLIALL